MAIKQIRPVLNRRDCRQAAGIALASTATYQGFGYAATRTSEPEEYTFGKEDAMNDRVLITYATRAGSTAEVASAIGETIGGRGFLVDVKPVKENPSPDGYKAVIMGSAVRMGGWLAEAVNFIKNNQAALNNMPVALFTVHILNLGEDEESRTGRLAYLKGVRPLVKPVDEVFFAGRLNPEKLPFVDRLMAKMVKPPIGDLRDWDKIRAWADAVLS
jgi:menaquinone-dependent protoporphyrinogen oxidase